MRKRSAAALLLLIGALAAAAAAAPGSAQKASPTKLTVWGGWSAGHELTSF